MSNNMSNVGKFLVGRFNAAAAAAGMKGVVCTLLKQLAAKEGGRGKFVKARNP